MVVRKYNLLERLLILYSMSWHQIVHLNFFHNLSLGLQLFNSPEALLTKKTPFSSLWMVPSLIIWQIMSSATNASLWTDSIYLTFCSSTSYCWSLAAFYNYYCSSNSFSSAICCFVRRLLLPACSRFADTPLFAAVNNFGQMVKMTKILT